MTQDTAENSSPQNVNRKLLICCPIMLGMYILLLSTVAYNTLKFVIRGDKYKNFYITYFYMLVYIIVALRMTWLTLIIWVVWH